jgi:outer membrane protein
MKRVAIVAVLLAGVFFSLSAQQITRFAVVDLVKVYSVFFNESRAVREFNERSAEIQNEINRLNRELQALKADLVNAQAKGDREQALRLESEVNRKTRFIQEYYQVNMADLEAQKAQLAQSDTFLSQINSEVKLLAETEGYSMVINKQEGSGILWYSPTVDITNKLIEQLRAKAGR